MKIEYSHLNEECNKIIDQSKEARIMFLHNEVFIEHPKIKKVHSILNHLIDRPKKARMQNILIIGESNIGKTSMIKSFEKKHSSFNIENEKGKKIIVRPVITALASDNADVKHLYMSILDSFWTPHNPSDSLAKIRHQMFHLLQECNVKMLIIDEIHHFLRGTAKQQRNVMDALKNIGNILMIPIVCAGLKESELILSSDPQLSSRFDIVRLTKWELDKNFLGLLKSFEKRLPLSKPSNLFTKEKATLLHLISRGNIGDLHKLLIECATYAIQNDIEEITVDIIKKFKWIKPTNAMTAREIPI
ncbi:transposase [Arcobacter sp. F155]|uniref:TniB family NTP-binding protein n=1 Tax=Arcobacter sp. F155 TaxID=2044512 RepID=UPI00100C3233|nr:TniB family NTP-binding protein [Arcobacter sp. F155]RXJ77047.1 transposase [Arcobacter sp. F155]